MTSDDILLEGEERMEKAAEHFRDELRGLRTGRATPALVDSIKIEYYGSPTPLKQIAQISTPDPQQIVIRPYEASLLKEIEKAIRSSDLGMSPTNDGKLIRLSVPPMSGAAPLNRTVPVLAGLKVPPERVQVPAPVPVIVSVALAGTVNLPAV